MEVGLIVAKVQMVGLDNELVAVILIEDKIVVEQVEIAQILDGHLLLIAPRPLLNMLNQVRQRCSQINHQVGLAHDAHHVLEEFHIGIEVSLVDVAHFIVVDSENIDAFED